MKKRTLVLEIKAVDIRYTLYLDASDCAITRALQRAGYKGYKDVGVSIEDENGNNITSYGNESYIELCIKVLSMYSYTEGRPMTCGSVEVIPTEPVDFTHTITIY